MKKLTLADGTQYEMTDASAIGNFQIPVTNYAEIDVIRAALTAENLSKVFVGVAEYHDVIVETVQGVMKDNGDIMAVIFNRMGTEDIIQDAIDTYTFDLMEEGLI